MRILYVCADKGIPLLGGKGASVHVRQITSALQRAGHEVTVAAVSLGSGAQVPDVHRVVQLGTDQMTLAALVAGADLVIERYSLDCGQARLASTAEGVPFVLEVNAPLVAEAARFRGLQDLERWSRWERATWASADVVVTVSRALQHLVAAAAPDVPVHLLRNGVLLPDLQDRSGTRAALGLSDRDVAVAFVGSMKPWHGVLELLEAFTHLAPPAVLLLAGHGPLDDEVHRRAQALGARARFLGAVPHTNVAALLGAADLGVAPYLAVEDFYFCPLKVLEYLAAGLPVVYTNEGDIAEIVGPAGVAVPAGDVPALAQALEAVVDDHVGRTELARSARDQVAGGSWDHVAARLLSLAPTATLTGGPV